MTAPTGISVQAVNSGKVYVSWSPVPNILEYGIVVNDIIHTRRVNPAKTKAAVVNLQAGQTYQIAVSAKDATGVATSPFQPVTMPGYSPAFPASLLSEPVIPQVPADFPFGIWQSSPATDVVELASGAWVGMKCAPFTTDPGLATFVYRSPSGAYSTLAIPYSGAHAATVALAQHPDGTIWAFSAMDGAPNATICAVHLAETSSGLQQLSLDENFLNYFSSVSVNIENPFLIARPNPAKGTVALLYQCSPTSHLNTEFAGFSGTDSGGTSIEVNWACPLGVCSVDSAGNKTLRTFPDLVERLAQPGDFYCDAAGSINLAYARFDPVDMCRDMLCFRSSPDGGATWTPAVALTEHVNQDLGPVAVRDGAVRYAAPDGHNYAMALPVQASGPIPIPVPPIPLPAVPSAPSNLAATAGVLKWKDNSDNEAGFIVEWNKANGNAPWKEAARTGVGITTWAGAQSGRRYRVRAFNSAGSSAPSNVVTA